MTVTSLSFEPKKGHYFVSASQDSTIKKWGVHEYTSKVPEEPVEVKAAISSQLAHEKYINVIKVSPGTKNKVIATASHDRSIKIWEAGSMAEIHNMKGHKRGVWDVSFCPYDRVLASASGDQTIKLWNCLLYTSPSPRD